MPYPPAFLRLVDEFIDLAKRLAEQGHDGEVARCVTDQSPSSGRAKATRQCAPIILPATRLDDRRPLRPRARWVMHRSSGAGGGRASF
jgi:hypothetical protein